jgi:hypothetical protein
VAAESRPCPEEKKPGELRAQNWSRLSANTRGGRALDETCVSPCGNRYATYSSEFYMLMLLTWSCPEIKLPYYCPEPCSHTSVNRLWGPLMRLESSVLKRS